MLSDRRKAGPWRSTVEGSVVVPRIFIMIPGRDCFSPNTLHCNVFEKFSPAIASRLAPVLALQASPGPAGYRHERVACRRPVNFTTWDGRSFARSLIRVYPVDAWSEDDAPLQRAVGRSPAPTPKRLVRPPAPPATKKLLVRSNALLPCCQPALPPAPPAAPRK